MTQWQDNIAFKAAASFLILTNYLTNRMAITKTWENVITMLSSKSKYPYLKTTSDIIKSQLHQEEMDGWWEEISSLIW